MKFSYLTMMSLLALTCVNVQASSLEQANSLERNSSLEQANSLERNSSLEQANSLEQSSSLKLANSLDFSQAWTRLLLVSDKLQASDQEVNRAKAGQEAASALSMPSLSLNASYTRLEKPIELDLGDLIPPGLAGAIGPIPSSLFVTPITEQDIFRSSLQAMWPIYTGGKISAAQAIKAAQVSEKQEQLQLLQRDLFVQLVDRYYGVAVTQALAQTRGELVASLQEHALQARQLEREGQIAKVERLNALVALDNARVNFNSAKRQAEMAQIALSRMLHERDVQPISPLFILPSSPSLPQLTQLTLSQHPALKLLQAKEAQAEGLVDLEKGGYYPTVFLYGSYNLYKDDSLFSEIEPDWVLGVGLKMPLLSRDGHSGKVKAAKSALLQARYTKAQTKVDLSLLLDQSYRQLLQAGEEVESLQSSLSLARENKRLRDLSFKQGFSTSIEKVDAELKLAAVQTQQLGAKYHYIQAYARLMAVSGQLDEFIGRSRQSQQESSLNIEADERAKLIIIESKAWETTHAG